jgi:hypothetical protein
MKNIVPRIKSYAQQRILETYQRTLLRRTNVSDDVIVFLVPGFETITGGILSIFQIYYATKAIYQKNDKSIYMMSYANSRRILHYRWFKNEVTIYPFDMLMNTKYKLNTLVVHVPEYYVNRFLNELNDEQIIYLKKISNLQINVMNQNIELMPQPKELLKLQELTDNITITTAHLKYSTPEFREYYGVPTHYLSSWFDNEEVYPLPYEEKENILIVSPDNHPLKTAILNQISINLPLIKIIVIKNIKYEEYKSLEKKAKWSITFGEGCDGYLLGPILRGGIGFAVYNEVFFTAEYSQIDSVFNSFDELQQSIIDFIVENDNKINYEKVNKKARAIVEKDYSPSIFENNVKDFYDKKYLCP